MKEKSKMAYFMDKESISSRTIHNTMENGSMAKSMGMESKAFPKDINIQGIGITDLFMVKAK